MNLQESGEMYLETVYILSLNGNKVRSVDVCDYMGYSKPSISRAVSLLKNAGYLIMEKDSSLTLTDVGLEIAKRTYERHTLLTDMFVRLGVPEKIASLDACKIEHDISEETFEALKNHFGKH